MTGTDETTGTTGTDETTGTTGTDETTGTTVTDETTGTEGLHQLVSFVPVVSVVPLT